MYQWTVDAFASAPFKGNPACVVQPFDRWPSDPWMQALAAENHQSETAFLLKSGDPFRFGLRWMTPTSEVRLCGHATLAAAHVLFTELDLRGGQLVFDTLSGVLTVERQNALYRMDFPAERARRVTAPMDLADAIGVEPIEVWVGSYLITILSDEHNVRALRPDLVAVEKLCAAATGGRGDLVVASLADPGAGFDVVSRFFAPSVGVPEDPATGSAHCLIAPLFSEKLGRETLRFFQAYPGRGAEIQTHLRGDRVVLSGAGVTVIESRLRIGSDEIA
jgi:PhzF family phenazine biosynthesis protein